MGKQTITIQPLGFELPVATAAKELQEYLPRLAAVRAETLPALPMLPTERRADIVLGTSEHLKGLGLGALPRPDTLDDALAILPKGGGLYLTGSNPRSVLFAAYRLLEELGAVFLRPGTGGEVLPRRERLNLPKRSIRERASYRHRGICIEGLPRVEHVLGILGWMAKKKMNSFQLQFFHGGALWRRGYSAPEVDEALRRRGFSALSESDCEALDERVIARMRELGMVLHRVGHGWTARTLGYPGNDWYEEATHPLPPEKKLWPAEVNGKRELWHGWPTNTELCYSRSEVLAEFAEQVIVYARQHPEVDCLHIWLSDSTNNKCECAACRTQSPTDWYILLMNELVRRLRKEGLATRLVFLAYQDLIWPPEAVRPVAEGAVFMYAPSGRCYFHALGDRECGSSSASARPPLNRLTEERLSGNRSAAEIAAMWKQFGLTDTFVFDYHQWRAVWSDALGYDLGTTMAGDIRDLGKLGLNGMMSCQCIRSFYPTPYLENVMTDMLWNKHLRLNDYRRMIMGAAFGKHAAAAEQYLSHVQRSWRRGDDYDHKTIVDGGSAAELRALASFAEKAMITFARLAASATDEVIRVSLRLLSLHAEQTARILRIYLAGIRKDRKGLASLQSEFEARLPVVLREFGHWVDPIIAYPVSVALEQAAGIAKHS